METRRRAGILATLFVFAASLSGSSPALAVAGALDSTFGGTGKVTTNFTTRDDFIRDVAIQDDGKIVAVGAIFDGQSFAVARYEADGDLDPTFEDDGAALTNMTGGNDVAQAVAIQPNQKIVVAGLVAGSGGRFGLARYETDGELDPTFGGDGKVFTNLVKGLDQAWSLAIQDDGKIVAAGAAKVKGGAFAVVRYNSDGSRDTTFSGDGKATTNFTSGDDWGWDVGLQDDGKIVVSGVAGSSGVDKAVALVRYKPNGSRDGTFSGDGKVLRDPTSGWDDGAGVAIQTDGKIVTAGAAGGSGGQILVLRFNPNGSLDDSFSADGQVLTDFTSRNDLAWDVALQVDGRIVVAGVAGIGSGGGDFAVARYGVMGALDGSFSGDGKVATSVTTEMDVGRALAIQVNGRIVVGGRVGESGGRFGLARYLGA